MDILSAVPLPTLLVVIQTLGLPGLVVILWTHDQRQMNRIISKWQEQVNAILSQYKQDMQAQREMYTTNVALVKKYENLASSQADTMTLLLQVMTRISERIEHNMFCPVVRGDQQHPPRTQ